MVTVLWGEKKVRKSRTSRRDQECRTLWVEIRLQYLMG